MGRIVSGDRVLDLEAMHGRAARVAGGLNALGVRAAVAVALMIRNDFAFFEASFGAGLLGAYAVPINWHNKAEEAGYVIEDSGARALVVHADLIPQIADGIPQGLPVFVVDTPPEIAAAYGIDPAACDAGPHIAQGRIAWDRWVEASPGWNEPPAPPPQAVIYTSGTTGRPKGVRRFPPTADIIQRMMVLNRTVFGFEEGMRVIVAGPMYHSAPNFFGTWSVRHKADLVVLMPRYDSEQLLAMIEHHRITHLYLVPTMFVWMLKLDQEVREKYDVSSLKQISIAAAPCPPTVKQAMIDWWGPIITEFYGSTETGAVTFASAEDALKKPGTVGRAVEGGTVKVLDASGNEMSTGSIGEIFARNSAFPDFTYHKMDEKRGEVEKGGLITSGDIGYVDEDGYVFLCDRAKDMVISGGVNIYPAEVEACLISMPGVRDVAVFGVPDEEYGESLAAVIQPDPEIELSDLAIKDWVRKHLAGYKVPKMIEFREDLPREDSGKIFKRKLREPYWQAAGRMI